MIHPTEHVVSKELLDSAYRSLPSVEFKFSLNEPTGDFFYDSWKIKEQFKDTVWEELLNSLSVGTIGEARLINLDIERCYTMHADIDDRWHLSFNCNNSYLVDLSNKKMYQPDPGIWYSMDAGRLHSAVNFGDSARYQLVVRQLLTRYNIVNPIKVIIDLNLPPANYRYILDRYVSPKLNMLCKNKKLSDFKSKGDKHIEFVIEKTSIPELDAVVMLADIGIKITYHDSF
tara:strand:+ start:338 stop:1027 length:690 start_codon:yes stop_codon:yes gene_type:complete